MAQSTFTQVICTLCLPPEICDGQLGAADDTIPKSLGNISAVRHQLLSDISIIPCKREVSGTSVISLRLDMMYVSRSCDGNR
jgi:hypothetical protein